MSARFGMRTFTLLAIAGIVVGTGAAAHADNTTPVAEQTSKQVLLKGSTTASYYWDDSSGRAGDTGLPASGLPMQKGMAASPSWPLMTEGYVVYKGKKAPFFVGDRGPGSPSNNGIMLDLDAKTFAYLLGGTFNSSSLGVDGVGGEGHAKVEYVITKWGTGVGKKNHPVPFSSGAYARKDSNPAKPPKIAAAPKPAPASPAAPAAAPASASASAQAAPVKAIEAAPMAAKTDVPESNAIGGIAVIAGLALLGGGVYIGRSKIRQLAKR